MIRMPDITAYRFGKMTIDGKSFTTDLVILPSGEILDNWRRKSGHLLQKEDISPILRAEPDHMIIGTGASGRMKVDPGVLQQLTGAPITVEVHPTEQAVQRYRELVKTGRETCACFHLTC